MGGADVILEDDAEVESVGELDSLELEVNTALLNPELWGVGLTVTNSQIVRVEVTSNVIVVVAVIGRPRSSNATTLTSLGA